MKNKKIILILMIFALILSVTSVSAGDVNETDPVEMECEDICIESSDLQINDTLSDNDEITYQGIEEEEKLSDDSSESIEENETQNMYGY